MKTAYSYLILFFMLSISPAIVNAQELAPEQAARSTADTIEDWSYHYQFTGIQQTQGRFDAAYSGQNSLSNDAENPYSVTATLFLGKRLWSGGEIYVNPEMAGGGGFSSTKGIAGFPNGEVYRVDDPSPKVALARLFIRQNFSLGKAETVPVSPDQNQLADELPASRLTVTTGRFSLTDIFDDNAYSADPRTQFMNWAIWAPGAWDYAADTRGYDWGWAIQMTRGAWALNFAAVMMPTVPNGSEFDTKLTRAFSLNSEAVYSYRLFEQEAKLHLIGFFNHADMGNYREAINEAAGTGKAPDLAGTRSYCSKYGFALCLEQPLGTSAGFFGRLSWNNGTTETFVFTEIDQSCNLGLTLDGESWQRREDVVGIAYVVNGLSNDHRDYLAAGGYGFIIGDGRLNYALEQIVENYYSVRVSPTFSISLDNQFILNPGYNRDRGPFVDAFGIRGHIAL